MLSVGWKHIVSRLYKDTETSLDTAGHKVVSGNSKSQLTTKSTHRPMLPSEALLGTISRHEPLANAEVAFD
jgi:hypothetical protein